MQVLLVTFQSKGGMVQYASQLANALADKGSVIQITDKGVDRSLFSDAVDLREVDFPSSVRECGPTLFSTLASIRSLIHEVDITHLTIRNPIFLPLIPTLSNTNFVFTIHDVEPHTGAYKPTVELTDYLMVRSSDIVLVHGEHGVNQFKNKYGNKPSVESITHGDYSFFRDHCPERELIYNPELLFFGRIRPYKGIDVLLEAEQILNKKVDMDYKLTIAGSGPVDEVDQQRIESAENIQLINRYIENNEVCEMFSRCRGVVLPYKDATQTGVIPIAYSFKKPVVATAVGGIPEVVEDGLTGYLVESKDPNAFAQRCEELLSSESAAKHMGKAGDRFRREEMSWEAIGGEVMNIYKSVLS